MQEKLIMNLWFVVLKEKNAFTILDRKNKIEVMRHFRWPLVTSGD